MIDSAGIIDENVDASVGGYGLGYERGDGGVGADIAGDSGGGESGFEDLSTDGGDG